MAFPFAATFQYLVVLISAVLATSVQAHVLSEKQLSVPIARQLGSDCSKDPLSCGPGFYCCNNVCEKSVEVSILFAGDDMGELFICQQNGYESVAKTSFFQEAGAYTGLVPCKETFLKVTNTEQEGGASIVVFVNGIPYGSGSRNLSVDSQPNFIWPFTPVVLFPALNSTLPYSDFISQFGAKPIKDANNSFAAITNFRFTPPTC